ncbi:MAG: tetratricopeptide repeat protein [Oligoflexus sp.]
MDRVGLLLDLSQDLMAQSWEQAKFRNPENLAVKYLSGNLDKLQELVANNAIAVAMIFVDGNSQSLASALRILSDQLGYHPSCIQICSDSIELSLQTFACEYGVDEINPVDQWAEKFSQLLELSQECWNRVDDRERKLRKLWLYAKQGKHTIIASMENQIAPYLASDFLANYVFAVGLQTLGRFQDSIFYLKKSISMNQFFRPAQQELAQSYLIVNRYADAIRLLENLDLQNDQFVERKLLLASSWAEQGNFELASQFLETAKALDPRHPKLAESYAEIYLIKGQLGEAFKMMQYLEGVGPFFAAKLNEIGIKLSVKGKGQHALALYKKAHQIVRPELKYKISLNTALACYRLKKFQAALRYLDKCETEFGQEHEKVQKVRGLIKRIITSRARHVSQAS